MSTIILSRIIQFVLIPPGLLYLLFLSALVCSKKCPRLSRVLVVISLLLTYSLSLQVVTNLLSFPLESQNVNEEVTSSTDAIVVLGGDLRIHNLEGYHPSATISSLRCHHAALLFRLGKAPLVLVAGGFVFPSHNLTEAELMAQALVDLGVPKEKIILESHSRNTFQNGEYTKALLKPRGIKTISLVTSAWHMPRARAVFEKNGFIVEPEQTDYFYTSPELDMSPEGLLPLLYPEGEFFNRSCKILREYLGYALYALTGRL